jgi:hypothetical protein
MNPNLPTQAIDTDQYLTVGALLEKIQFDDLSNRIAVCVENPEAMPPSLVTLLVMTPETEEPRQLFVWVPVPGDAVPLAALNGNGWTATSERLPEVGIAVDVTVQNICYERRHHCVEKDGHSLSTRQGEGWAVSKMRLSRRRPP